MDFCAYDTPIFLNNNKMPCRFFLAGHWVWKYQLQRELCNGNLVEFGVQVGVTVEKDCVAYDLTV